MDNNIVVEDMEELSYEVTEYVHEQIVRKYVPEWKKRTHEQISNELYRHLKRILIVPPIESVSASTVVEWFNNPFVNEYDKQEALNKILAENKTLSRL